MKTDLYLRILNAVAKGYISDYRNMEPDERLARKRWKAYNEATARAMCSALFREKEPS